MITIKNLTLNLYGEPLFEKVSFTVQKNDCIGIVGPNGAGKSTLFKMILGKIEPDSGTIESCHERIGYLPQEPELDAAYKHLSGGEKTRLALGKILLAKPTMLLLDEPTNHLDVAGLQWLEETIKNFRGGVVIISHDRRLLDNTVSKILELDSANHTFKEYAGNFTAYKAKRKKQLQLQEDAYERQQKEKKRLELWLTLKKQEATLYADPAKGKQIRAMEKRIEREIYQQVIERPKDFKKIKKLSVGGEVVLPKLILHCENVSKDINGRNLFKNLSFEIRGKERVLLSGKNGTGKTTLLKIIIGETQPDSGRVRIGNDIKIGYFAQEHEMLDPNKTVLEEFETVMQKVSSQDARSILGGFLFSGQSVFKKVCTLSLGERARLVFAKLTHEENHLLVLDEPTNHLDIGSRETIEKALVDYQGAILAVSHDRYFIDRVGFEKRIEIVFPFRTSLG